MTVTKYNLLTCSIKALRLIDCMSNLLTVMYNGLMKHSAA